MAETDKMQADRRAKRKKAFLVSRIVLFVVVAVAAGAFTRWWMTEHANPKGALGVPVSETAREAQNLRVDGQIDKAQEGIAETLKDPKLKPELKYDLYMQQGHAFVDQGKLQDAVTSYEKAAAVDETYETSATLAEIWVQLDNKPKAIEYYKKAITLISTDNPLAADRKATLEQNIRNLGGQP